MTDETEAVRKAIEALAIEQANSAAPNCSPLAFVMNRSDLFTHTAITTLDRHRIERAGDVERRLRSQWHLTQGDGLSALLETGDQAAATIATLRAEIERLTERAAQAKLDGVRAGIDASAVACDTIDTFDPDAAISGWAAGRLCDAQNAIRALSAEAIAKGV